MLYIAQNANQLSSASNAKAGRPGFGFFLLARVQTDSGPVQSMPEGPLQTEHSGWTEELTTYIYPASLNTAHVFVA
jgi:hypothetical protein